MFISLGLTVATERQIAANRRNARKSTGPRSTAGKSRARRNAYRHGLSATNASTAESIKWIDRLARKIAGDTKDPIILEHARTAAHAEFDLAKVRHLKVALIDRLRAFGDFAAPQFVYPPHLSPKLVETMYEIDYFPMSIDAASTMPTTEPERTAEAVRRALPQLRKLDRYEQRAAVRRRQALAVVLERRKSIYT